MTLLYSHWKKERDLFFCISGKSLLSHCVDCSPGRYCLEAGNDTTTGDCQAGYYCTSKAEIPNPTGKGKLYCRKLIFKKYDHLLKWISF